MTTTWEHTIYDANTLGCKIRDARKRCDMTQQQLAAAADIDRSYMGRIERGMVNITVEKLYRLANVLNCPTEQLVP